MTVLSRTGLNEGIIINAAGANMTEYPDGLPNQMVGTFYYDFSGLTGVSPLYTNEATWVISDGRTMRLDPADDSLALLDNYDPDETVDGPKANYGIDRVGVDRKGYTTTVKTVYLELRLGNPSYRDVEVLETAYDDNIALGANEGMTNAYLAPVQSDQALVDWLDAQATSAGEVSLDIDTWWQLRAWLRWSLHWALYKVPLSEAFSEAEADDLQQADMGPGGENSADGEPVEVVAGVPDVGPPGLIYALGGGTDFAATANSYEWPETSWVNLCASEGNDPAIVRYIRRGDIANLPYSIGTNNSSDNTAPQVLYEFDALEGDQAYDSLGGVVDAPDVEANGREVKVRLRLSGLNVHVSESEMLVLHVQSGRARLRAPINTGGTGARVPGLIIASGNPALGPRFTVHHHVCTATASNRKLK